MYTVIETPIFLRYAAQIWGIEEREAFVRWAREGMGKRGGARVIYFNRLARGEVVFYLAYAKAKLDNMRPEFLVKLKEQFDG